MRTFAPSRAGPASLAAPAVISALALLLGARAAAMLVPGGWLWGLDASRQLPGVAWAGWIACAATLLPAVARRLLPIAVRAGDALIDRPAALSVACALLGMALVLALPDRVHFTGDYLLREHSLGAPTASRELFPQAMPLDAALHDRLPRLLMRALPIGPAGAGRVVGALDAAALGIIAAWLARALTSGGAAAFTLAGAAFWFGGLALMTGYDKALSEASVATLVVGGGSLRLARTGRGGAAVAAGLACGLLLHRLAALLAPVAVVGAIAAWRSGARRPGRGTAVGIAALAVASAVLVSRLPWLASFDVRTNFLPAGARGVSWLAALDLIDLLLLVAPLAPLVLLLMATPGSRPEPRVGGVLGALLVPLVGFLPLFHSPYGPFRNWDAAAATGAALSLSAGVLAAALVERHATRAWLAIPIVACAAAAVLADLASWSIPDAGLARIEAYATGPPRRSDVERATAWDFLGFRLTDLGRLDAGAAAFERAADLAPSPRTLRAWAAVERLRGDSRRAEEIYRRLLERQPDNAGAWLELAELAASAGDLAEARRAAGEAARLDPGNDAVRRMLEALARANP